MDTNTGKIVEFENDKALREAQKTGNWVELGQRPNPGCKRCRGRGWTGRDVTTGEYIPCKCVKARPTKNTMKQIVSEPNIYVGDLETVADSMGVALYTDHEEVLIKAQRELRKHVVPCIKQAINEVVRNRDLPGQQHFWEDK